MCFTCDDKCFFFSPDAYGCPNDPSIYFTDQHNIKCLDLTAFNYTHNSVYVKTLKTGLADVGAIDMDARNRIIYYSDLEQWTINRMNLATGEIEVTSAMLRHIVITTHFVNNQCIL